jgi:hypothetical protein
MAPRALASSCKFAKVELIASPTALTCSQNRGLDHDNARRRKVSGCFFGCGAAIAAKQRSAWL